MGFCLAGMGECGNKSSNEFTSNVSIINQTMTNMVSSTSNSSIIHNYNVQNNAVKLTRPPGYTGVNAKNCTFLNNQQMNATQKVSVSLDVTSTKNLQNQISNALKTANDTAIKQKTAFLQTASNESSTATTVNEAISNLVSTNISDEVRNSLDVILNNAQNNDLTIEGPIECTKENPYISSNIQNMLSSQIVDSITKALTGTTVSNLTETTSDISNKNDVDQEGEGITGFLKELGKLFTGSMTIIAVVVIVVAIIGAIVFFVFIKGGSKSPVAAFGAMLFGRKKVRFGRKY